MVRLRWRTPSNCAFFAPDRHIFALLGGSFSKSFKSKHTETHRMESLMKYRLFIVTGLLVTLVGFIGCATLKDYKAKTAEEEGIKTTLVKFYEARNNFDVDGFLSVYHEDAKIMVGSERVVLPKKHCREYLTQYFSRASKIEVGSPKMNVRGDEATVRMPFQVIDYGVSLQMVMELVRENGKWYILSSKF